ncbi:hypothetical protein ABZ901_03730 [Actinacidiphila alni]|uniref:hypothetical protein n=1 Tax=Actinacidiphila alni TaxID=380248 RepID=UPI0033E84BEB
MFAAGALAAFGVAGMALSALGAPMTLTWAAATGAGIGGGWAAVRLLRRDGAG